MKVTIKTAHGYLSVQPDGRLEFRERAGIWEEFDIEGLELSTHAPAEPTNDDPLLGCVFNDSGEALVSCLCKKIRPAGSLEKAFDVTKRVAWGMRAHDFGLLLKLSGENIVAWHGRSFSASRVCLPDGRIFKVLTDVPTTSGPSWQDNGTVDPSLYVPAIDPRS